MRLAVFLSVFFLVGSVFGQGFTVKIQRCQDPEKDVVVYVEDVIEGKYEVSVWEVKSVEWLLKKAPDAEVFTWRKGLREEAAAAAVISGAKRIPSALVSGKPKRLKTNLKFLWTKVFKGELLHTDGVFKKRVLKLGRLGKGVYLLRIRRTIFEIWAYVCVTAMDVVVRVVGNDLLIWVIRKSDGHPVQGATVKFPGTKLPQRITPPNGLLIMKKVKPGKIGVVVEKFGEKLFASTWSGTPSRPMRIYLYTDRPLYRPGEYIYFKGILRELTPDGPRYPGETLVKWSIRDAKWRQIAKGAIRTNRFGTFSAKVKIPDKPALGYWYLDAFAGTVSSRIRFEVRAYRKPDFKVHLKTDKTGYVQGEKIKIEVKAHYLFGPPLTDAELTLRVYRKPWFFTPSAHHTGFRLRRVESLPQQVLLFQERVKLRDGMSEFEISTERLPYDTFYLIEAQVTDKTSGIAVFSTQSVPVTRAAFTVTLMTSRNIYLVGQTAKISVGVRGFDRPVSGIPVRLSVYDTRNVRIALELLRTDNFGKASCTIRFMQPGYYRVLARATDAFDNPVSAQRTVLVVSKTGGLPPGSAWLEIIPDKESYKPGERAQFVILSSAIPTWRLLTLEGTNINEARVEHISSTVQIVEILIKERMVPALFVWVGAFQNGRFSQATRMVMVEPVSHRLKIKTRLTPKEGKPGKEVKLEVSITDMNGKPLEAEFSVALVDEALFVLREQKLDDPVKLFIPNRHSAKTVRIGRILSPYPSSHYLLRKKFGDEWNKEVAEIHKNAPHLIPPPTPSVGRKWKNAGRAVLPREVEAASPQLDGRIGLREIPKTVHLRKEFATTAFWHAAVVTDKDGKAVLTIKLPDNITTWRFTLIGLDETHFGIAKMKIVSRLPVMAQALHPRFLRVGDVGVLGARGHNETGEKTAIGVRFEAENLQGKPLTNERTIKSGHHIVVEGEFKATSPGKAVLRAMARSDKDIDATEVKIPVLPIGQRQSIGGVWRLGKKPVKWEFDLPDDVMALEVRVAVSSGYAAVVQQSIRYLVGYPYG